MAYKGGNSGYSNGLSYVDTDVSGVTGGIQPQDTLVYGVNTGGGSANTINFPAGFTYVGTAQNVSNTNTFALAIKVAGIGETGVYRATVSVADVHSGRIEVFSGRAASPLRSYALTPNTFLATPEALAVTGVAAFATDDLVQMFGHRFFDGTNQLTYTVDSADGLSGAIFYSAATQYSPPIISAYQANCPGGTLGTNAGTITQSTGVTNGFAGFVLALSAAPAVVIAATFNAQLTPGPGISPDYKSLFNARDLSFDSSRQVNVTLAGATVGMQGGVLGIPSALTLASQAIAAQAGTLTATVAALNVTVTLLGAVVGFAPGSVAPGNAPLLLGQSVVTGRGTIGAAGALTVNLLGVSFAASAGTLVPYNFSFDPQDVNLLQNASAIAT